LNTWKDLEAVTKRFRSVEFYRAPFGGMAVCLSDCYFGVGKTAATALKNALKEVERRKNAGL
jgi:hypothetical protein